MDSLAGLFLAFTNPLSPILNAINTPFRDLVEFAFLCVIGFIAGFMGIL